MAAIGCLKITICLVLAGLYLDRDYVALRPQKRGGLLGTGGGGGCSRRDPDEGGGGGPSS